ncbi:MAG: SGNH/GDSL hydrolase family protein [Bauldia sp.]
MIRTVLCFGDSNTWGYATEPRPDGRYERDERWPGVLQRELGPAWRVIEEGLNGRATVRDDPVEGADKNGKTYLLPCLTSHKPLDAVVIMLGTNDLKARFNCSAWEIAQGVGVLVTTVLSTPVGRNEGVPEVLVVSPPPTLAKFPSHAEMFAGDAAKSKDMAKHYRAVAALHGVGFLDAGSVAKSSKIDGFHLDPDAHAAIGKAVAKRLRR